MAALVAPMEPGFPLEGWEAGQRRLGCAWSFVSPVLSRATICAITIEPRPVYRAEAGSEPMNTGDKSACPLSPNVEMTASTSPPVACARAGPLAGAFGGPLLVTKVSAPVPMPTGSPPARRAHHLDFAHCQSGPAATAPALAGALAGDVLHDVAALPQWAGLLGATEAPLHPRDQAQVAADCVAPGPIDPGHGRPAASSATLAPAPLASSALSAALAAGDAPRNLPRPPSAEVPRPASRASCGLAVGPGRALLFLPSRLHSQTATASSLADLPDTHWLVRAARARAHAPARATQPAALLRDSGTAAHQAPTAAHESIPVASGVHAPAAAATCSAAARAGDGAQAGGCPGTAGLIVGGASFAASGLALGLASGGAPPATLAAESGAATRGREAALDPAEELARFARNPKPPAKPTVVYMSPLELPVQYIKADPNLCAVAAAADHRAATYGRSLFRALPPPSSPHSCAAPTGLSMLLARTAAPPAASGPAPAVSPFTHGTLGPAPAPALAPASTPDAYAATAAPQPNAWRV
jgi:hypothetical protein